MRFQLVNKSSSQFDLSPDCWGGKSWKKKSDDFFSSWLSASLHWIFIFYLWFVEEEEISFLYALFVLIFPEYQNLMADQLWSTRRTVNSNRPILDCSGTQNCKINKETRKRCQWCRFEVKSSFAKVQSSHVFTIPEMQTDGDEDVVGADGGGQDQACHEKGVVADRWDQCWGRRTGPDSYQKGDDYILSLISGLTTSVEDK